MFGYFAFEGFEKELAHDLKGKSTSYERLFITENKIATPWAQTVLLDLHSTSIESITKAASFLKSQKQVDLWFPYAYHLHRRTQLISENLRKSKIPEIEYLKPFPEKAWGHWCLKSEKEILYSASSSHPLPWGEVHFKEDKNAPSRAYLKLWEGFTLHVPPPKKGSVVVDMGSSPGGWVWVLKNLGCEVHSIDRSPLRDDLMSAKNVHHRKGDVFSLRPKDLPDIEWFFSDVICYPDKLFEWVSLWLEHPNCKNFYVTIKFQGKTDFKTLEKFQNIPNSKLVHLFHNKHEITWIKTG